MKSSVQPVKSLRQHLAGNDCSGRFLWGTGSSFSLNDLLENTCMDRGVQELWGRSVLLAVKDQMTAAIAMIELDGVARRMVVCPPDVAPEHFPTIAARADVDAVVLDRGSDDVLRRCARLVVAASTNLRSAGPAEFQHYPTQ